MLVRTKTIYVVYGEEYPATYYESGFSNNRFLSLMENYEYIVGIYKGMDYRNQGDKVSTVKEFRELFQGISLKLAHDIYKDIF